MKDDCTDLMKRKILFFVILFILLGIFVGGSVFYYVKIKTFSSTRTFPFLTAVSNWQTFTTDPQKIYAPHFGGVSFVDDGFSFKYPDGWSIGYANPAAIVNLYDANVTADIAVCYRQRAGLPLAQLAANPPLGECDDNFHSPSVSVIPSQYVDYATLDDWMRTNYPNYQKLAINGLDAFVYHASGDVPSVNYHINFPNKKTGIEFIYDDNSFTPSDYPTMVPFIVKSIRFASTTAQ